MRDEETRTDQFSNLICEPLLYIHLPPVSTLLSLAPIYITTMKQLAEFRCGVAVPCSDQSRERCSRGDPLCMALRDPSSLKEVHSETKA